MKRKCLAPDCDKEEEYDGYSWKIKFLRYQDGWVCKKHHAILVSNPKRSKETLKKYNDRRTSEYIKLHNKPRPKKIFGRGLIAIDYHRYYDAEYNPKRIKFKNKRIKLDGKPRKGQCEWCFKQIGDEYVDSEGNRTRVKLTNIHHIEYYIIFPWFATVELCNSCHSFETWRLKRLKENISKLSDYF